VGGLPGAHRPLSGPHRRPPGKFQLTADGEALSCRLNVANIENIAMPRDGQSS
jgi:hypothetical protein